ncbi:MAG: sigma-54-dependent Fis family transcriptional regulator [Bacteroidales bacterium]|nr:sigma-54-dependent Fis family transcriptional regulator [Bacteroidales bacterium]
MTTDSIKQRYDIVGNDPKLLLAINKANQVAPTDLSILITGESGVGKDVFSRIVHDNSLRKSKKLVSVNCGAIPEGTIESELFGHLKGSFTGADKDRKGYFEEANDGTIFLDEVGELPLQTQVKLLRVLENGEILPVGSSSPKKVNVRVVAATNVDILQAVRHGRFREDLYYRLNQISIAIPPLRERKDDIYMLFCKFSSDVAERYHMPPIFLDADAKAFLCQYPWYGNIRELKNITEQMAVVEPERTITRDILRNYLTHTAEDKMPALYIGGVDNTHISDRELLLKVLSMGQMISDLRQEVDHLKQIVASMAHGQVPNIDDYVPASYSQRPLLPPQPEVEDDFQETEEWVEPAEEESLDIVVREKQAIIKALQRYDGNRRLAAKELGISERTLYRKINDYEIEL